MDNLNYVLSKRRTLKILSNKPLDIQISSQIKEDINEMIYVAGKAPFHYPASKNNNLDNKLNSVAPWRFYIIDSENCRKLSKYYSDNKIEGGKIIKMLNCATVLIQATWIPENNSSKLELSQKNIEHVAATSAAIQNLLLSATNKDYESYWSSGGTLRNDEFKSLLKIPINEQLLGSLFLFKDVDEENIQKISGAWRNKQGNNNDYSTYVAI